MASASQHSCQKPPNEFVQESLSNSENLPTRTGLYKDNVSLGSLARPQFGSGVAWYRLLGDLGYYSLSQDRNDSFTSQALDIAEDGHTEQPGRAHHQLTTTTIKG